MIFLEDEYRAFCPTGTGGGVKNDCSPQEGVGRVDNSWKREQGPVRVAGNDLKKSPPAKSLAGVKSVTMMDGELVNKALREVGVTLDQAAKACAAIDPQSDVMIAHGGLREIVEFMGSEEPDRYIEDTVTFTSTMPVAGIAGAAQTAVSLTRLEDGELAMAYSMLMISDEAKKNASVAVARQMMKGTIASISQAEKIGVSRIEMLAAGDSSSGAEFKGYRIWPRLGFDGTIPRSRITPTWSLARGFFNSYGSGVPDKILSPRAKKEKAAGALTIQALYETKEGQEWWEKNGGEMKMSLSVGKSRSLGWKRFKALRDRFSKRSIDLADAFFDDEARSLLDADWAEIRAACIYGEAELRSGADCGRDESGRFGSGNDCASDDESPMGDSDSIDMDAEAVSASPPFKGAEVLNSFSVNDVPLLKSMLAEFGEVKTVENVVAIAGGARQGGEISIDSFGEAILIDSAIPVSPDGSDRLGSIKNMVSIMRDDDENLVVAYDSMSLDSKAMSSIDGESEGDSADRRRIVSLVLERMTESMSVAEKSGAVRAETIAAGNSGSALQGYRLWPQFGFDGPLDAADIVQINSDVKLTPDQKKKVQRGELTVQDLIATPEGDRWWNENGTTIELTFDFKDKGSVGYKRFERMKKMLGRLKERNKNRSVSDDGVEYRDADCEQEPNGQFAAGNDCAKGGGTATAEGQPQRAPKTRNVDVMIAGGKTVAALDSELRDRSEKDLKDNPKPPGSSPASATDVWPRTFVERSGRAVTKITSSAEVFPKDRLVQNGTYVAHEDVGQYLSMRHAEARKAAGGEGDLGIIDTTQPLSEEAFSYIVEGLAEDTLHAYEQGRLNPGFYSDDLEDCMRQMATRHPELESDVDARFVFTMLTAITSNGQDPEKNIVDADRLYAMYRQHGTCVPSTQVGGTRDARPSLRLFQSMLDSFGVERTRRLLSGYTTAQNVNETLKAMSDKSGDPAWRERTGATPWMIDHFSQPPSKQRLVDTTSGGEFPDEVVPMASIFGPKIGSFFANLNGRHDFLTMDRWFMRTVGRMTGELVTRSTPDQAKARADAALKAIESAKPWSKEMLFGIDKKFGIKKEDVVRSLKIQQKTGVIEENGAAFIWAAAAERSHGKTLRPGGGGYGKHSDPHIRAAHEAGNSLFKSLIHEQQDPRGAQARRTFREAIREVVKRVEERYPERKGKVDIDEVQAILWQYEKNLWKHLGGNVRIDENSLYSKAARELIAGRIPSQKPSKSKKQANVSGPLTPERRSTAMSRQGEAADYDEYRFSAEQDYWQSEIEESGVDFNELFVELEKKLVESKASRAFCPTGDGGGIDNSCGSDEGSAGPSDSGSTSRSPESLPKSFPRGSEKFRDAIDSVAPDPKAVWDRSRGRADTPPSKVLDTAADEQTSSGSTLTPEAEKSYAALIDEIGRQYEALTAAGLKARAWRGEGEPYGDPPGSTKPNSDQMRAEVARTGEFSFFMTDKGFGTGSATPNHPMLRETKYKTADGEPMIANDLFRVVHDMVAHVRGGYSFSTNGEFNGMLTHASTLPEEAWPALFAETFGQNAVYEKTGNYAAQNAYASKVGPEIIKAELAKRNRKVRRAVDAEDEGDEPLGYQHIKVRPWLMKGVAESRAYCPTGDGGGIDNSCSASDKGKEPIPAGDKSLKFYEPFDPSEGTKNSDFAAPPSDEEAMSALNVTQREKYGAHRELPAGYPLDLRIDIKAFENHGTYVVTAHEHVNGLGVGTPIGYDSIIRLKGDVDFRVGETAATKIARGKQNKDTHSTVKGKFDPSREIPEDIDDWTPVGYNPKTATYYYDKRNGKEIVGGVDSISVGNSVFVRVPKYGNGKDPSKQPRNAKTDYRSADCGRDESGKFGSGNDCAADEGGGGHRLPPPAPRTGTPEFKAWFGDSKVVDESGAPSVVYHGTTSGWTEFDESKSHDIGFHAGTREQAVRKAGENQGSNVMPVFLSIEKPIRLPDHAWDTPDTIVSSLEKAGIRVDETLSSKHKDWQEKEAKRLDRSLEYDDSLSYDDYKAIKSKQYDDTRAARREVMAAAKAAIKKAGFDGVVYKNEVEGAGDSWIAFDASQIKSASGNSGKFDKTSKSIVRSFVARSADCGRDESGKFGSGNDCASGGSGGGAATAAPSGDRWSSNETLSWPETSRDTSPPPVGDGRYGSINVSAPKAVKASLDAAGIDPKLAPMVAGGSEGSDVFVRPAPDFSMEFPGSDVTPVMFAFERDFAGVDGGLHGSSVIGVTASGEVVVHHSTISVSDKIKSDDSKRHAAAREFYRAMTASVEAARKAGVSRIVLNAAGNSSATKGSVTSTPWRGYTIWPRMGFDAPLPASIRAKLPPDLSHAKSLLDLHATQEGTRWWRDNGEDLDVSFDPNDRSSPQSKVMDRFIKKFGESRRDMPLGAGDEWLSPADLLRLDEMWQEIWDDGDLDDYEWTESRSSDCGRDESGRFGPKNDCASDDSPSENPAVSSPKQGGGRLTRQSLVDGLTKTGPASKDPNESLKLLRTGRRFEIVGSFAKNIDARRPSDAADFASKFLATLGTKTKKLPEAFIEDVSEDVEEGIRQSKVWQQGADRAACLLAEISAAVAEHPEVLSATLLARDAQEVYDAIIASGDHPNVAKGASESAAAMYSILSDTISINTSVADQFIVAIAENAFAKTKQFSSSHPGHALIHELGHMVHYRALREAVGLPARGKMSRQAASKMFREFDKRTQDVIALFNSGTAGRRADGKIAKLSQYGATHPSEFVAEYYAGLATGAVARDADLDKVAVMLGFPADKLPEGKKKK